MTSRALPVVALLAVVGLGACGSHSATSHDATAATLAASKSVGTFKDGDVAFTQGMIPHHEQAIEMADMALDPAAGAGIKIKDLAGRIKAGQDPEIKQMTALLTAWGKPVAAEMAGHDMGAMTGMMSADSMKKLGTLKGAEFDKAWATMMIEHHKGAIEMANTVKKTGANPAILALATKVIAAQEAEIKEMTPLAA
jgi:uncharacterized protein (DUF305 family)